MPDPNIPIWPQPPLPCSVERTRGGATRIAVGDASLHVLQLAGSLGDQAELMGAQVGALGAPTLRHLAGALERTLRAQGAPLPLSMRTLLHPLTARPLIAGLGSEWGDALPRLARAVGISAQEAGLAHVAPELILWAQATYHRLRGTRSPAPCPAELMGCTSIIARAPAADRLYHGRNLDLTGVPSWRAGATVTFCAPEAGMRYVAVGAAGLLGAGLTAMNSAGLTLAAHHHLPAAVPTRCAPIHGLTELIMRRAHTIAEATDLARRHRPAATWTLVMTEGDTGEAAALEIGPSHERLYRLERTRDRMAYTNIAWDQQIAATLLDGEPAWRRAGMTRLKRARQLLFERGDALDRGAMLAALGDQRDAEGTLRLGPSALCGVQTAASVLFEPGERRLWVGVGQGSVAHGLYVPLSLEAWGPDAGSAPVAPAPTHGSSGPGRAQARWAAAWGSSERGQGEADTRAAMIQIEHALAHCPDEPDLQALAGLLAMREGRGARAEGALRRALELEPDGARRAELGYLLALAMELHGLSGAATEQLQQVISNPLTDPITRDRAREARWAMPTGEQLRGVVVDMLYAGIRP